MSDSLRSCADLSLRNITTLVDQTNSVIIVTDKYGQITWVNPGFTTLTGYTPVEAIGQKPGALLQGPDTDPMTVAEIRTSLDAHRPIQVVILNYSKSGRKYWLHLSIYPVTNEEDELVSFVATEIDLTEEMVVKQKLVELSDYLRQKITTSDQMMKMVTHDIRAPLSTIHSMTDILFRRLEKESVLVQSDQAIRRNFQFIQEALSQLEEVLEKLLPSNHARDSEEILLRQLVDHCIAHATSHAMLKDVTLLNEVSADTRIRFIRDDLRVILRNLVLNSVKFCHPHGLVVIRTSIDDADQSLSIEVVDNGIGIDPIKLALLRQFIPPGESWSSTGTDGEVGTGSGLLLCHDIARQNMANLEIDSELGTGTTITVRLQSADSET